VTFPHRLALATKNAHKVPEILRICGDWPVTWVLAGEAVPPGAEADMAEWPDVEETGTTYEENARLKAIAVARTLGLPAVADDSGIEVDALGGAPGYLSAMFAGPHATDRENLDLLIERIRDVPEDRRTGRYVCVAIAAWPDGREEVQARGTCQGRLLLDPRGTGGFGYDPIFVPAGESRTMAELSGEEKDAISHRGRALRALREALAEVRAG
jgi:XTP/dITP diphosphohydrolase